MSMSESTLSQASTKVGDDLKESDDNLQPTRNAIRHLAHSATAQDILLFLIAFRILNALTIHTFFQPDEYFQSLEPAWQTAFGPDSGAWITWVGVVADRRTCARLTACQEWKNQLRSAIHPGIFAAVYWASDAFSTALQLPPSLRADLMLAAPKTVQAIFAALGDYYTWKLAQRVYGHESSQAWTALALTVVSPWQWFVSTRTLSNCLETTVTIIALYNWPWHWSLSSAGTPALQVDTEGLRKRGAEVPGEDTVDETERVRRSLLFAAIATIMRPTNILIWATLALSTFLQHTNSGWLVKVPWTDQSAWVHTTTWSFVPNRNERFTFFRETVLCGALVLLFSLLVDRFYYQTWAFPPLNFLYFNVVQSLSSFYGNNNWHYYLSEGYPLLLTTALPFALTGIYNALRSDSTLPAIPRTTLFQLATISIFVPFALSAISHKEVRFIYPLLPPLHILSASPVSSFFGPAITKNLNSRLPPSPASIFLKRALLAIILITNITIAFYTSTVHNSGLITVTSYLRHQHETHYLSPASTIHSPSTASSPTTNMTVAFLMPCHSTPWRSHLLYPPSSTFPNTPGISAWALTCDPPLNLDTNTRATYLDEADVFYADPTLWLRTHMSRHPPRSPGLFGSRTTYPRPRRDFDLPKRREWPDYLVFFEQLESVMRTALQGSGYGECWRGFNSHWHDDWRRKGDVVVWCLDAERKRRFERDVKAEQEKGAFHDLKTRVRNILTWTKGKDGHALRTQPQQQEAQRQEGKTLGGGRGPFGIGIPKDKAPIPWVAGESTVEKPFWKKREKVKNEVGGGRVGGILDRFWPFKAQERKKRTSWWGGGMWS